MTKFQPVLLREMIDFYVESHITDPNYDPSIKDAVELELDVLLGICTPDGDKVSPQKFQIQLDPYKGMLSFNLLDYIRELDDDTKNDLVSDGGWWSFVSDGLIHEIKNQYARSNYNHRVLELRQSLLKSDAFPEILGKFLEALVQDFKWDLACAKKYEECYYGLYHSSFTKDDKELRDFISSFVSPHAEHPQTNEKLVDEMVVFIKEKFGLTEFVESCLKLEAEILAEKDPEASARVLEREERLRDNWRY